MKVKSHQSVIPKKIMHWLVAPHRQQWISVGDESVDENRSFGPIIATIRNSLAMCYDNGMKTYTSSSRGVLPSWMVVPGAALLILAGCGTRTAKLESPKTTGDSKSAQVSNDSGSDPIAESRPHDQPAPILNTTKPVMTVTEFGDAALNGQLETVRQGIESGIDINAIDDQRRTALMLASFNGHTKVVRLLLESGANVDDRDAVGRTALMFAATGAFQDTIVQLLDAGAEINAVDSAEGFTALMHAAAEGQLKVVQVLLERQADPAIRDVDGDTALDFANRNGHTAVVQLLSK